MVRASTKKKKETPNGTIETKEKDSYAMWQAFKAENVGEKSTPKQRGTAVKPTAREEGSKLRAADDDGTKKTVPEKKR